MCELDGWKPTVWTVLDCSRLIGSAFNQSVVWPQYVCLAQIQNISSVADVLPQDEN